ncbi:hypothetical protein Tco_0021318 [Tanacetum coccineum]
MDNYTKENYGSLGEDYRIGREINRVHLELNNVVTEKDRFLEELDSLGVWAREMELNARKKELFIEKLKGCKDFLFARQIYWLRDEINDACENRIILVKELEEVRSMIALAKAAEILKETQLKDGSMMAQLQ